MTMTKEYKYRPTAREMNYMAKQVAEANDLTGNRASRRAKTDTRSKKTKVLLNNSFVELRKRYGAGESSLILHRNARLQKLGAIL